MSKELVTSCPKCGQSEEKLIQYGEAFTAFCPKCTRIVIGVKKVHPDFLERREPKHPKKPKEREPKEEEKEEEEMQEGAEKSRPPSRERGMFERPSPPEQVLRDVLERYDAKEQAIKFLERRSRMKGGIHPTELQDMLQEFTKTYSGIADKKVIPYIAEEYALALEEEDNKRRETTRRRPQYGLGIRGDRDLRPRGYGVPGLGYKREEYQPEYERRPVWDPYQQRWTQQPPQNYPQQPYYSPPYPPKESEELKELKDELKQLRTEISEKREKDKFERIEDRITTTRDETRTSIDEVKELIRKSREEEAGKEKTEPLTEEKIKEIIESKDKDAYVKYLDERHKDTQADFRAMRDEFKDARKDFKDTITEQRQEYDKKLDDAKAGVVGSTDADVKREAITVFKDLGEQFLTAAPIRRTIRDIRGGEVEKPPKREEATGGKSAADYADEEFVEEEK